MFNGYRGSVGEDEKVLEVNGGDGLKMVKMVSLCYRQDCIPHVTTGLSSVLFSL